MIPTDDRGFTLGDGLFETVLAQDGVLWDLAAHLARMTAGCAVLGLPAPNAALAEVAMREALDAAGLGDVRAAVRLTWTAGSGGRGLDRPQEIAPRMIAAAAPAPRPMTPVVLATATVRRNERSPTARLKSLTYLDNILARRQAQAVGADEAVMLNTRDEIACATLANLFWLRDGRVFTPALECGVLAGTARARLMSRLPVIEVRAGLADLAAVEAMAMTNSLIGARAVSRLDGRELASQAWATELNRCLDFN